MEDVMVNKQSDAAANLGFRPGTKAHQAANFYLRPDGATDADIRKDCGGLQRNLLSRIAKAGHTDASLFRAIAKMSLQVLNSFNAMDLAHTAWAARLFFFLAPKRAQGELSQGEARGCCAGEGWRVEGTEEPVGRPVAGAALMESNTRRQSGRRSLCQRGS